jgi:pyruvate-ferredoxin/flavodoxin oxidoreductase
MLHGVKQRRSRVIEAATRLAQNDYFKAAAEAWLAALDDAKASRQTGEELVRLCKECDGCGCDCDADDRVVIENADVVVKPSFWVFGGDGWAYDIGYGGLDHVLASGENINVLVFDTEVYSNTGGQASKATPTGAVAQFAAAGKSVKKKDLAQIAISYGYIYVAQISMGANYMQTLKALQEAEAYDGPSLVICYAPCINHGNKNGMGRSILTEKQAVESGYWNMFRYDPRLELEGQNPLSLDSKEPSASFMDFILNEVRYSSLKIAFPNRAEELFARAEKQAAERYQNLVRQKEALDK